MDKSQLQDILKNICLSFLLFLSISLINSYSAMGSTVFEGIHDFSNGAVLGENLSGDLFWEEIQKKVVVAEFEVDMDEIEENQGNNEGFLITDIVEMQEDAGEVDKEVKPKNNQAMEEEEGDRAEEDQAMEEEEGDRAEEDQAMEEEEGDKAEEDQAMEEEEGDRAEEDQAMEEEEGDRAEEDQAMEEEEGDRAEEDQAMEEEEGDKAEEDQDMEEEEGDKAEEDQDMEEEEEVPYTVQFRIKSLGDWTAYNGLVFNNASIYQSFSGGGFAVSKSLQVYNNHIIGANYTSNYDSTKDIGEYKNEKAYPALMIGGNSLYVNSNVNSLNVFGGSIVMNEELMAYNNSLSNGFKPLTGSAYETVDSGIVSEWFQTQYELVSKASEVFTKANDVSITIKELSSGAYASYGPTYFENQYLTYHDEIYKNALFINVRTDSEVNFGQWWPIHSLIDFDVNWAMDYDLLVFSFPDAVNVTMNSSSFNIRNVSHWSTTSDAWIGEQGMAERLALAEKVVYNFPNAGSIEANQALIQGSILAPGASFTGIGVGGNGHIYGHIVVRNYYAQGNFTIHPFELSHWAFDLAEDTINKDVKTGALNLRQYLYLNGQTTNIRLEGGAFHLIDLDGKYYTGNKSFTENVEDALVYQTNATQNTIISDVPLGAYILQNTQPPQGFLLNESDMENGYTYANYPINLSRADELVNVVRYTEPAFIDLSFQMVDAATGTGLKDGVFIIVRDADEFEDTTYGATYTSDESGLFTCYNLPVGTYRLMEIHPPKGYELLPEGKFYFQVVWDENTGNMAVVLEDGIIIESKNGQPIQITNNLGNEENTVALIKYAVDEDNNDTPYTLSEGTFLLYRYNPDVSIWENTVENMNGEPLTLITNEWGYCLLNNLENGLYRLVEVAAPVGYRLKNQYSDEYFPYGYAYEFTFSDDISHYVAYIPNIALEAEVKVNAYYNVLNESIPIQGISYRLEHLIDNGRTWEELIYQQNTDSNGQLLLTGLKKGSYRLTQLQMPPGYFPLLENVIYFDLSYDAENTPVLSGNYNGEVVGQNSYPVSVDEENNAFLITYQVQSRKLSLYKIDNDYSLSTNEGGETIYNATYLPGAEFRLQRRTNARMSWADYGSNFTSIFQYEEDGTPILDVYGNHIAAAVFDGELIIGDYQVVETKAPQGFHTNSSIKVTLDDGVKGDQVHLFTITQAMVGTGQESRFIIENYEIPLDMSFRLMDIEGPHQGLEGGKFLLYPCDQKHAFHTHLSDFSCFFSSDPITATSDGQGYVTFHDLKPYTYLLIQDKAPTAYELSKDVWLITVNSVESAAAVVKTDGVKETPVFMADGLYYPLYNEKQFILPMTGGAGVGYLYLLGIVLIAVPLLYIKIKEKGEIK